MGVFNYYMILGIPYDASVEMIRQSYERKMPKAKSKLMVERYKTAYYVLTNPKRRYEYDLLLGIHQYKKVSVFKRIMKSITRVFLTLLDALFSFYWCFVLVVIIYATGLIVVENDGLTLDLIQEYILRWKLEIYLLAMFSALDLTLHYYIRRLNRFLKHYKWEVTIKKEEGD